MSNNTRPARYLQPTGEIRVEGESGAVEEAFQVGVEELRAALAGEKNRVYSIEIQKGIFYFGCYLEPRSVFFIYLIFHIQMSNFHKKFEIFSKLGILSCCPCFLPLICVKILQYYLYIYLTCPLASRRAPRTRRPSRPPVGRRPRPAGGPGACGRWRTRSRPGRCSTAGGPGIRNWENQAILDSRESEYHTFGKYHETSRNFFIYARRIPTF